MSLLIRGLPAYPVCISFLLAGLAAVQLWATPRTRPPQAPESVVAVGDVHNDFDDFVAILRHTGVINQENHWIAGRTTFVQVGDLLDRGPKPREVMDLMMALEKEAAQAGGRVVSLLGNHEVMNMMGDLRYVPLANYASFTDGNSAERQRAAYNEYLDWRSKHAPLLAELQQPMELTEAEWMARHPPGFIEQREALGPKGKYGEWLRGHAAVADIEGIIFLHGGLHPSVASMSMDAINKQVHEEIKEFDELKQYLQNEKVILPFFTLQEINNMVQAEVIAELKSRAGNTERQAKIREFLKLGEWLSVREDGPLWFRGYDQWSDEEGGSQMDKILEKYKATRIVVGHTVQRTGRIRPRFGNRVFLIDTGMLSSYYTGGRPSALEVCDGATKFVAVYSDQQATLVDSAASGQPPAAGNYGTPGGKAGGAPVEGICSGTAAAPQ